MKDKDTVPKEVKDQIIKEYLMKSYHWSIGFGMFLIGFLLGALING